MLSFNYYQPTEIRFGRGRVQEVGEVVSQYGNKCLLVTVPVFDALAPVYQRIKDSLKAANVEVFHFDGVVPNPTTESVDAGTDMAIQNNVQVVLGVGGGSSMDTAKAISVGATHSGRAWDYRLFTDKRITAKRLPIVTVTTTSGTGSQVTPVSVVTNTAEKCKFAIVDKLLCPSVSIVDPDMMMTVPKHITASTGFDVFAHAFESYIHKDASIYTDMHAIEAMKIVIKYLPVLQKDGFNKEAREKMAWADTLAGLCIANAGTTLPHGIGMAIGGHAPHVMHGEALAITYPEFADCTYAYSIEKFAIVSRLLNSELDKESDKEAAKQFSVEISKFLNEIGMYFRFEDFNITKDELGPIADDSIELPDYTVNPWVANRDEIFDLLNKCYKR